MDVECDDRLVYSVEECARLLSISKCLCYELVRQHRIPSVRLGERRLVVPRAALERMLEAGGKLSEVADDPPRKSEEC